MPVRTLTDEFEEETQAIADAVTTDVLDLHEQMGDRPAFSVPWQKEDRAALYLAGWFVYGNAEPEVSGPYWDGWLDGVDPLSGEVDPKGGPDQTLAFDADMYKLWHAPGERGEQPPYVKLAHDTMTEDVRSDYRMLLEAGLHLGAVKPPAGEWIAGYDREPSTGALEMRAG